VKATVIYLLDGIVQPEDHKGDHIEVHIHDDPGPHKRGYVRVDGVDHLYASVVKIEREGA
jgi:hypothetical protein